MRTILKNWKTYQFQGLERLGWLRKNLRFSKSAKKLSRKFLRKIQFVERAVSLLVAQKTKKNLNTLFLRNF